ncbi:MAG: thioredoxin-disulfide reductase [Longimicrobiales bacterium]
MSDSQKVEKVAVVGSGPAAWTAAIYAARANLDPLVLEGMGSTEMIPGGQLMFTTEVENFPGFPEGVDGQELMARMRAQAERYGTRIVTDDVVEVDLQRDPKRLVTAYSGEFFAKAVIIATGARANWLGLENETRLARSGGGVSACAVCDGALPAFRDQPLVVVGGGDSAMTEAEHLAKYGSEVIIVHRRGELRASRMLAERVLGNPKVRVEWNAEVVDVLGEDSVTGVRLRDTRTGEERTLSCKGVFMAIGHTPNTAFLKGAVELKDNGYIRVEPGTTQTNLPGVFGAGDVIDDHYRQAITAAGTGCMAALDAEQWIAEKG